MDNYETLNLVQEKEKLQKKLNSLVYGSIEIREKNENKYIYVHYRDEGKVLTKYVGEYSDELYNLILKNNLEVKSLKNVLKKVVRRLKSLNYTDSNLSEKVKMSIDFAKRNLVDTIYNQAILEGVATTFLDTESIIEGGKVNNMNSSDVMKIVNLKHAWEFILSETVIESSSNLALLSQINKLVEEGFYYNAGNIRNVPVKIGGTNWTPDIPIESMIVEGLNNILNRKISNVDKAIELLLYVMKKQIYLDGNKRTAVIFANHFLISKGLGVIVIPADKTDEYKSLLISYYEGKDTKTIHKFLKDKCYLKI